MRCHSEEVLFRLDPNGYLDFVDSVRYTTTKEYAESQERTGSRIFESYVRPWLNREPYQTVLDVGCGMGRGVKALVEEGGDAFGVDLPHYSPFWGRSGNDPSRFVFANAVGRLPFPDDFFDAVYSLGVIEHIGTTTGHLTLSEDYLEQRKRYASELLRVLRPGGRVLVSCPHKRFPIDIQHGPGDEESPAGRLKEQLWRKAHITIHKPFGTYYLPSYGDIEEYFGRSAQALPLRGYFGFSAFERPVLRPFAKAASLYVENLPAFLRRTPLNPYVLAQIRK